MNPQFIIYTGPMFGSKTTRLMSDIDRFLYKGRNVIAFKAKKDQRYTKESISTHTGATYPAFCINHAEEILCYVDEDIQNANTVIAVDEAFMIQDIDLVLISLYRKGVNIIVSSIQLDTKEIPFENIKNMMPWATKIEICPAVCTMCDQDAYFTEAMFDIENATQEEKIGSFGMYEPRCFKHYSNFNLENN